MPDQAEVRAALWRQVGAGRAAHSERVAATAAALAGVHGLPVAQAELAGLLHDWYKEVPSPEILDLARGCGALPATLAPAQVVAAALHGPVAARLLPRRWPDLPPEVLSAVDRHTTGDPEMTAFDALLYVADLVEPAHAYPGVDALRALAGSDLWGAVLAGMDQTLGHVLRRGRRIDARTVAARNALLHRRAGGGAPAG